MSETIETIEDGDIIAVITKGEMFSGCLMFVDEVKPWGAQAGMVLPDGDTAYVRLTWDQFIRVTHPIERRKFFLGGETHEA